MSDERESAATVMAALERASKAERKLLRAEQAAEGRLEKARARLARAEARVRRRQAVVTEAESALRKRQAARAAGSDAAT